MFGATEEGSNRSIAAGPTDKVVLSKAKERAKSSEVAALAES